MFRPTSPVFFLLLAAISCVTAVHAQEVLPRPENPFTGKIGLTYKDSTAVKPELKIPENFGIKDAPNILLVLIDDCGFGQTRSFGSGIPTPALDRVAKNGICYIVPNPIGRYMIEPKTPGIKFGDDGSLTITMSHKKPSDPLAAADWLPAPKGGVMRDRSLLRPDSARNRSNLQIATIARDTKIASSQDGAGDVDPRRCLNSVADS